MTRKRLIACVGLLVLVLAACGPAATPTPTATPPAAAPTATLVPTPMSPTVTPQPPQELVVAQGAFGKETLDPTLTTIGAVSELTGPLWEWPVETTEKGELEPLAVTGWEQAADGLSWTLKLRQGVKFHDGQEMTAEDIKFSLEGVTREKAIASRSGVFRKRLKSIEVLGPYTVRINTKGPWVTLIYDISTQPGSEGIILPKHYIESVGWEAFNSKPMGAGPGKFVNYEEGNFIEFDAFKDYWRYTPKFDKFRFILVPEESSRIAMIRTGQADVGAITLDTLQEVKQAGMKVVRDPQPVSLRVHLWGTYMENAGPIGKLKVRQALNLAINRQEMVDTLYFGQGKPAAVFPSGEITIGFPSDLKPYPFDPAKAKQLLAEAGYPKGFEITLTALQTGGWPAAQARQSAEAVAGYWENIGVRSKIVPTDVAGLRPLWMKDPQDPELVGTATVFATSARLSGADDISIWWSRHRITKLADNIDEYMERATKAATVEEMAQAVREAYQVIYNDYRSVPMVDVFAKLWALGPRVESIRVIPHRGYIGPSIPTAVPAR